jgi:hypothetical protein
MADSPEVSRRDAGASRKVSLLITPRPSSRSHLVLTAAVGQFKLPVAILRGSLGSRSNTTGVVRKAAGQNERVKIADNILLIEVRLLV